MKRVLIAFYAVLLAAAVEAQPQQTNLIPAPVAYSVRAGSVSANKMAGLHEKVRISEKALLRRLEGRKLADWQLKSAYWLELGKKGVKIEAADKEGVFYARQTLKMMASLDSSVTCCTILDWPRFRHRGVMLDESRHFQGKDFVKKQLEMMALLKMNRFHFHLVDNPGWRVQIDAYPRLTKLTAWRPQAYFWDWEKNEIGGPFVEEGTPDAYGGYYTKQDIADILSFADERHIEVIPEIEMPGHNYETRAAYPELACSLPNGGKDPWELCPGKESTFEFLEKVLLEVFDMFPSKYIHIGGDEARKNNWKLCPDCQARMKAEGLKGVEELQSYMIRRMERFAHEHGKRIIGWDEILQGGLAPDATVMSWHGTEAGLRAVKEGHDVIFTPTHYFYLDYHQDAAQFRPVGRLVSLEKVYSFNPMVEGVSEAEAHHVLGIQGCLWTEHVQDAWHAEMMLYPRVFAIAETGWSQAEKKNWPDFDRRASVLSAVARKWGYTVFSTTAQETFKFGTNVNPDGVRFEVDSRGFIIGGQRVLPVMGEIHFSRVPQTEWRREIQKMRAGGVSIVATYVFWNHHEAEEGEWDWSGNRNLRQFLEICRDEQMPVVLRIGPFCHGEVWQGGFPDWLTEKSAADSKNFKLRSTAEGFMDATRSLYKNIFAQVNGLLWKQGGTVVGIQIENESRGPWSYFSALKEAAVEAGFDTPFYTRTGWPKLNGKEVFGEMLPLYGDYADGFWDRSLEDMPGDYPNAFIMKDTRLSAVIATEALGANQDTKMEGKDLSYPYLTCELGGGMMQAYHRRINMSGREVKPLAICKLGSGSNLPGYYMYHGGTNPYNPRHTMAETQASAVTNYNDMPQMSYDFQAILGEMGKPNAVSWNESRLLHEFLKQWGGELSLMDVDTLSDHYARRGAFEFRNDYVRIINEGGRATITPRNWQIADGVAIQWATAEPYCKADDTIYFIAIDGQKPRLSINGKTYNAKPDKPFTASGMTFCVLSKAKANTSYKINDKLYFSDGLLYQDGKQIIEEKWQTLPTQVACNKIRDSKQLRRVAMGRQKVAAAPTDEDFENAAVWELHLPISSPTGGGREGADLYLQINYRGDVARIYADGQLVEDNFWNGKPMLVRMSDLVGKRVELRILPLGKDYPIYLQREQRALLDAAQGGQLLSLDSVKVIERLALIWQ